MNKLLISSVSLLATSALVAQGRLEASEPNNTMATAAALGAGAQGYGEITAGDEDWFKITLTGASDLKIWTAPGFGTPIGDTRVRVLASDGSTELIDVDDGNTTTHGYYSTITLGNYAASEYYVAVRGYSSSTTGTYTLDVVAAPIGTFLPIPTVLTPAVEGPEDNDPRLPGGMATLTMVNTMNAGNISVGGGGTSYTDPLADYDFYELNIAAGGQLRMETVPTNSATPLNDSVLFFIDPALNVISQDDDGGVGFLSLLNELVAPGQYFVAVKGYGIGDYDLEIEISAPLVSGIASVISHAGGCAGSVGTPLLETRDSGHFLGARPELPILGSEFFVDASGMPAGAPVFRMLGLLPRPAPLDLGVYGATGCFSEVDAFGSSFVFADANGNNFWGIASPFRPGFIGLPVEMELVVLDPGISALGVITSNRLSGVFGTTH